MIGPIDAASFQVLAHGFERAQEFSLLDREGADGEADRRALLQQEEDFQEGERILAAGKRHGNTVAIANHLKSRDGLAHFAQQYFFEVQDLYYRERLGRPVQEAGVARYGSVWVGLSSLGRNGISISA